jgi:hypothetical protein
MCSLYCLQNWEYIDHNFIRSYPKTFSILIEYFQNRTQIIVLPDNKKTCAWHLFAVPQQLILFSIKFFTLQSQTTAIPVFYLEFRSFHIRTE